MKGCWNGCVWIFAIVLVVGACIQMPILIPLTIIILGLGLWARVHTEVHK